ncbi:Clavaminate synthase-like protein [Poronia punctata]|nr:Clavaminate synthase-like protein [Poronia punctata]
MVVNNKNGTVLCTTTLPTLHLDKLRVGDESERKKLYEAIRVYGFFYLDLTSDPAMCGLWEEIMTVAKEYFGQPLDVKMQDARGSDNTGYEPKGTEVGPKPETVDGYESLKISRREYLNKDAELTSSIKSKSDFFFHFMETTHAILTMMLSLLSDEMGLEGSSRFEAYHSDEKPTQTNLTLMYYPKHENLPPVTNNSMGHNKHTDIGSLTFLLCQQWGLQILTDNNQWAFVEPRPNHAIINAGDSLRFPSGGKLASVVHRVIPLGDEERQLEDRYSFAYFLRVNDDVPLMDGNGKLWSAKDWHDFKFDAFRFPDVLENAVQVLTGMMERDDVLVHRGITA